MIFYEAPHKLPQTLRDLYASFGDRKLTIVREITKIHEEVIHTTTKNAAENLSDGSVKGEIVLVLEGAPQVDDTEEFTLEYAVETAKKLIENGARATDAAKEAVSDEMARQMMDNMPLRGLRSFGAFPEGALERMIADLNAKMAQ